VGSIPIARSIPSPALNMRRLYQAANRVEAQRLLDLLAGHGIAALIPGEYLSGAAGELPVEPFPEVWLCDPGQWLRARGLLAEFLAPPPEPGDDWTCPGCGETLTAAFRICWNCATPRDRD
jgi:hypothetical protein